MACVFLLWQTGLNLACLVAFDLLQASPAQRASLCSDLAPSSTLQDYVLLSSIQCCLYGFAGPYWSLFNLNSLLTDFLALDRLIGGTAYSRSCHVF